MNQSTRDLQGVGLEFQEPMSGFFGLGESDPTKGERAGKLVGNSVRFDVRITIPDMSRFLEDPEHEARLSGTVTCKPLGGPFPIQKGRFNLFSSDPSSRKKQMIYAFNFEGPNNQIYFLYGHKEIYHDQGKFDVLKDMTWLFTSVYQGENDQAPLFGAGILTFKMQNLPSMAASMKVINATSWRQKVAAFRAFSTFVLQNLKGEYLKGLEILYEARYENLVLAGTLAQGGESKSFFLVSGVHDKGFPWGDGETFSDVLLAIEGPSGQYERYCITDRELPGLQVDVRQGRYRYQGPLFALQNSPSLSFSEMRSAAGHLLKCEADFEIHFSAKAYDTVTFPFPFMEKLLRRLPRAMAREFRDMIASSDSLGIHITPHTVTVRSGRFTIRRPDDRGPSKELWIEPSATYGEAEKSVFRNVKEPTMLYGYICAVRPEAKISRVQIHSNSLRNEREDWVKDQLDKLLGSLVSRFSSAEILIANGRQTVTLLGREGEKAGPAGLFVKLGDPILEVNNDHYPTAVFQRRIIAVQDPSGEKCLALEEDMRLMRLEAVNSDRKVIVASIRDDDSKYRALDMVLDETGFEKIVQERLAASGRVKKDFSIVIKPNFMFAYDKRDRTTFTDPELVGHLVKRLRTMGFENMAVVEAQSTYGEYFDKRSVQEMARYLGYDALAGCQIIDMTQDALDSAYLGPHLGDHPVSRAWRDADFRISFAKNKTHAYAYYTLTLKNIYGALPLANKFKEYHCARDIYHTTIEYLSAFPVHFGLVDAYLSADGPFGIFADTDPNGTHTLIGGEDLVAVDWVAASKMGIDPMISKYMPLAVERFGKPEIRLVGDASIYRPWLNVPVALTLFTHKGLDTNYHFGNLFYTASAQMDETHFTHKNKAWYIQLLRKLTVPVRRMFFVRTGENPSLGNRIASWLLNKLGY